MNTIKFNDVEFVVENYNKNTYLNGETITSNANCTIRTDNMTALNALMQTKITSIQITYNETVIYDLQNISAHIDSTSEYLNTDRVNITLNLTFDNE